MSILIKNGCVIDPADNINGVADILIDTDKIKKVSKDIKDNADEIIDASGKIIMPGIVDMHVHLREPGREDKENIFSATSAALKGGVTTVLTMPNTMPPIDNEESVELLRAAIKKGAKINVLMAGCITKTRGGQELVDITRLSKKGIVAISDDGASVDNEKILIEALKKAKENNILVLCHCEDRAFSFGGSVNLGFISTRMGLRGISKESEYKRIERDIQLAEKSKTSIHITHVSCRESVDIIQKAKKAGVAVTCDTAVHYFSLTEENVLGYDTNFKMNPPLRTKEDVEAIKQGLKNGTIDSIISDHAPHTENEKDIEFDRAEFGIIGLETELAVSIQELVLSGLLSWGGLAEKNSLNPSRILKINKGRLGAGHDADIIIIDPEAEWIFKREEILSKSKNSPFIGRRFKGKVLYTIYGGKIVYESTSANGARHHKEAPTGR